MVTTGGFPAPTESAVQEELDPALEATLTFEEIARELDLEGEIVQRLRHPERELTVHLPRAVSGGPVVTFTGYRVQHSTARGPSLGGVCLGPNLHLAQAKAQAMFTTWQCALLDLPFGGAAGALLCDPARLSEAELSSLLKAYAQALRGFIGPFRDVLTPQGPASERIAAWLADGYAQVCGHLEAGAVTGKPPALAGLADELPGRYLFFLLQEILGGSGASLRGKRVVIEGFGSQGASLAALLAQSCARIVGLSDVSGGLLDEDGLDLAEVSAFAAQNNILFGYRRAEAVTTSELLAAPCDILVLTGGEGPGILRDAENLQSALVVEAAPDAVTPDARKELEARNCVVVPSLLAGAGGVLASYFEWSRNVRSGHWSPAELDAQLHGRAQSAYREVAEAAARHSSGLHHAAHLLAIGRVAEALRCRK
jgi:glutamate dehydrogenase (NAD(P)+)